MIATITVAFMSLSTTLFTDRSMKRDARNGSRFSTMPFGIERST